MEKKEEYKTCPECNKPVKHLVPHLKNKHKWCTTSFKDNMKELEKAEAHPLYPLTPEPKKPRVWPHYAPEPMKMDEDGVEKCAKDNDSDRERFVMRRFDLLAWIRARRELDNAIRNTYESLEECFLKQCLFEGEKINLRYDSTVVKYDVAIKRIRDTLKSSCDDLHSEVICEMEKLEDKLKVDLSMMSIQDLLL